MKILFINQVYPPDPAATGQQQATLAQSLAQEGHTVTVITSARGYADPSARFPAKETLHGVQIHRVCSTALGKNAKWKRAIDFVTYFLAASFRALTLPRHDAVVTLTTPPLISLLGVFLARLWRARFIYWVMDLNPDEAIAAGWLRPRSIIAHILETLSRFSLKNASAIISLDRFMAQRIIHKGIAQHKIHTLPPWSLDASLRYDPQGRATFRRSHGIENRFVIMYSGNHSPCHPLDPLLETALNLRHNPHLLWCFIGGGSEYHKVIAFRDRHHLHQQILCLPYQPLHALSASLSAADLHCVVMGNPFVGTIHPCKIYNILALGIPTLCIAPTPSHLSELADSIRDPHLLRVISPHDPSAIAEAIREIQSLGGGRSDPRLLYLAAQFSQSVLIPRHIEVILGQNS